jgi:pilus assembly protein CpaF
VPDLLDLAYAHDELADLEPAARRLALRDLLGSEGVEDVSSAVAMVGDEIDGFGPISDLMRDDEVTDIMINGAFEILIEKRGTVLETKNRFRSEDHLRWWCERFVSDGGGRIDSAAPIADVRMADGSRMHVVFPPIAPAGPLVSIRRFPACRRSLDELMELGSISSPQARLLRTAIVEGRSIVISGRTGTGKTTLLDSLLLELDEGLRVVVIEELPELKAGGSNRVSLVARPPNAEGVGRVTLEELVRASLRMRPDRVVVGEVRGPEALPAVSAAMSGHAGTMLSIHACSARSAKQRLLNLALMADRAPSEKTLEREISQAFDVYVHLDRTGGKRGIAEIELLRDG